MVALIFFTRSLSLKDCLDVSNFFSFFYNSKNLFFSPGQQNLELLTNEFFDFS
jgi:hypothetical protein